MRIGAKYVPLVDWAPGIHAPIVKVWRGTGGFPGKGRRLQGQARRVDSGVGVDARDLNDFWPRTAEHLCKLGSRLAIGSRLSLWLHQEKHLSLRVAP
jgi:hypothetical protein